MSSLHSRFLFAAFATATVIVAAFASIAAVSDDSEAALGTYTGGANSSTSSNPYSAVDVSDVATIRGQVYVLVGASIDVYEFEEEGGGEFVSSLITSVTDGFGLSYNKSAGKVTGTVSKVGTFTISGKSLENSNQWDPFTKTFIVVSTAPSEQDINFISPAAVSMISGGSISYTATTNVPATYSESGGTASSRLSVDSSTGRVSGTLTNTGTTKASYTYTIKATSKTLASNTATQTITIDVYPVAKISATSTSVSATSGKAISSITLTGNLGMSFSKASGSFPSGVSLSSSGTISGTPTETGSFSAVVRGTTSQGPVQSSTITIRMTVAAPEASFSVSLGSPGTVLAGSSVSIPVTATSISGIDWTLSGTAASWLAKSGNSLVGSAPSVESVTDQSVTLTGKTPGGQTRSATATIRIEPVMAFTSVPTADCVINPVYTYDDDGNPTVASRMLLMTEVSADSSVNFDFPKTLTIEATFTGSNAKTISWDWGDGTTDAGAKVQHTYAKPGTYTITLIAANDLGEDRISLSVHVGETTDILLIAVAALLVLILIAVCIRRRSSRASSWSSGRSAGRRSR